MRSKRRVYGWILRIRWATGIVAEDQFSRMMTNHFVAGELEMVLFFYVTVVSLLRCETVVLVAVLWLRSREQMLRSA